MAPSYQRAEQRAWGKNVLVPSIGVELKHLIVSGVGVALLGLSAFILTRGPSEPEAQIRAVIEHARQSAEAKDVGGVMDAVSESFETAPIDRRDLNQLVYYELHRGKWSRVYVLDLDIELSDDQKTAEVKLATILATGDGELSKLSPKDAGAWRFDLGFRREDGGYKVVRASYRRAELSDLMPTGP